MNAGGLLLKGVQDAVTLLASGARVGLKLSTVTNGNGSSVNEVQSFYLDATAGTYTLTFDNTGSNPQTTAAIAYNASAATVQAALIALSNITTCTVTGTGTLADPFLVTFLDAFTNFAQMTANTASLTASSTATYLPRPKRGFAFICDLTNAATDVGDTLDVSIETLVDGSTWVPVVHFTQILGNGSDTLRYVAKVTADGTQAMFEASASLAAGSVRNICGDQWRASWTIVDSGDSDHTFTFSVSAIPF